MMKMITEDNHWIIALINNNMHSSTNIQFGGQFSELEKFFIFPDHHRRQSKFKSSKQKILPTAIILHLW